jgi:hypothetical protein
MSVPLLLLRLSALAATPSAMELLARLRTLEAQIEPAEFDKHYQWQEEKKRILLQLGDTTDRAVVLPVLRDYAYRVAVRRPSEYAGCAHVALVKIGDEVALAEMMAELSDANPFTQTYAFQKLGMAGTTNIVRILGPYLIDETAPAEDPSRLPPGSVPAKDVRYLRRSEMAARALAKIIKPAPTDTDPEFYTDEDIQKWREWWEANKSKYQ